MTGWVTLAALIGRLLCGKTAQAGLGAYAYLFALVGRFVRERISVAGYDRAAPVFFKVQKQIEPACRSGLFKGAFVVLWPMVTVRPLFQRRALSA